MTITKGPTIKNLILYPPATPNIPTNNSRWFPTEYQEGNLRSSLTIDKSLNFKKQTEDDIINGFINQHFIVGNPTCQMLKVVLNNEAQGDPLEI